MTLFPEMFEGPLSESILRRARELGLLTIGLTNIRDFARDKHRTADDYPYGGGSGMVMKPDPIFEATDSVLAGGSGEPSEGPGETAVILLSARGRLFDQALAAELATQERLVLICGRYKGVDERVTSLVTHEISIGDYVLTGGEIARRRSSGPRGARGYRVGRDGFPLRRASGTPDLHAAGGVQGVAGAGRARVRGSRENTVVATEGRAASDEGEAA